MTRLTVISFVLLTFFFYVTGKPVDETAPVINSMAALVDQAPLPSEDASRSPGQISSEQRSNRFSAGRHIKPRNSSEKIDSTVISGLPNPPVRNPRRIAKSVPSYVRPLPVAAVAPLKPARRLARPVNTESFGTASNRIITTSATPLAVSYRQRFVRKTTKPVLGPRLTAVLLKRELRRVGCYSGIVTGNWDPAARAAVLAFNQNTGARLSVDTPTAASLQRVQRVTTTICKEKPQTAEHNVIRAAVHPSAGRAVAATPVKWRTRIKRNTRAASIFPKPVIKPRYKSIGSVARNEDIYRVPVVKRNRISRKISRKQRVRKIRIARRKARRRTAVRSWKRYYRRKRFGFRRSGTSFSLD